MIPAKRYVQGGILVLVALMPFHAFFTTWLGTSLGHRELWQAWKEALLVILGLLSAFIIWKDRTKLAVLKRPVNIAIFAFIAISILASAIGRQVGSHSFWLGAKTDLEFLVACVLAQLVTSPKLEDWTKRLVMITGGLVGLIAIIQVYLLPADFLKHFGYGPTTIEPFRQVDPAVSSIRVLATLGGPNQLGSFMILPSALFAYLLLRKRQWWAVAPLALTVFALVHSYSRSALLGLAVALVLVVAIGQSARKLAIIAVVTIIAAGGLFAVARTAVLQHTQLEYYLLHGQIQYGNELKGSDQNRIPALQQGLQNSLQHPLGRGLGTSGPASFNTDDTNITEDYYLQLAIETGLAGLAAFLVAQVLVASELVRIAGKSDLAIPLLAALAGIAVFNLFLHGWADSSTALVFWSTAGVVIGNAKVRHSHAKH
jgi:hypothetical protein